MSEPSTPTTPVSAVTAPENAAEDSDAEDQFLDLRALPPIYVLSTHLDTDTLHVLEDEVLKYQGNLTYDAHEAKIFLGKVTHKRRAILELKSVGLVTVEAQSEAAAEPAPKVRRLNVDAKTDARHQREENGFGMQESEIVVVTLSWLEDSVSEKQPQNLSEYLIYKGVRSEDNQNKSPEPANGTSASDILARAQADLSPEKQQPIRAFASKSQAANTKSSRWGARSERAAALIRQTTDERNDSDSTRDLPELPDWAKRKSTYSCERSTPDNGPNAAFVAELKKIRLARTLTLDEIGVRAYSTSIAAVAAYPHVITDSSEISRLPGCDTKIAALWVEWKSKDGFIKAAHEADTDPELQILRLFYDIWSVGAQTARNFYNRGWRCLDDIVEYGWDELSRTQQIGVKYYDEFKQLIPRAEVEAIVAKVHEHAQRVREPEGVRTIIVGGYRRGKEESGDVDVILTHTDESQTLHIVQDVVESLMEEGYVTHELVTSLQSTRRGQATLPFRRDGGGHGFDNLDKALVVWQDPEYNEEEAEDGKNPNVHRRVDIIIAPWSRIGCAVLGWSAGTTFERDLRRFVKHKKKWKFDSSGIRDRITGKEVDLESIDGPCLTAEEAERKVFAGMGLVYREPWERCTG